MSDELKPWTSELVKGLAPNTYGMGVIDAQNIADAHNKAVRAAVKERGEDTKLRKTAQALADQCPREQCYELWEALDSALQQQPGGKS